MKNNIKNKVLIISLIFLILTTTYSSVFASSVLNCSKNGCETVLNINSEYNFSNFVFNSGDTGKHLANFVILEQDGVIYGLAYHYFSDVHSDFKLYMSSDNIPISNGIYNVGIYKYNNNSWTYENWANASINNNGYNKLFGATIKYTTSDIYTDNTYGTVFFQQPPTTTTMKEIMTQVGEQSKAEILPTILKVIATTVFLVISLIGSRKGFQILVNGLKT